MRLRSCVAIAPFAECCASRPKLNQAGPSTGGAGATGGVTALPPSPPPPPQPASATTATEVITAKHDDLFRRERKDARRRKDMRHQDGCRPVDAATSPCPHAFGSAARTSRCHRDP